MVNKVNSTVNYLKSKMSPTEYNYVNDLVGCFLDIQEALELDDLDQVNAKLFNYFREEDLFAGNVIDGGYGVYLSAYDKQDGAVEYYLEKAIEHVFKEY